MVDEQKKENRVGKAFMAGRLEKYGITRKTMYSGLSIFACMALIIVLSVTQAYFDPNKVRTIAYWVSLMIQVAICIFGMISGKQAGDDISRNLPNGRYRVSLGSYSLVINSIKDMGLYAYIGDWLEDYRERKLQQKIRMALGDHGIKQPEVLDLDFSELDELKNPGYRKDWEGTPYRAKYWKDGEDKSYTYFVSYTEDQIAFIRFVKKGGVKVSHLPSTFFVSVFSESEKDEWESSAKAAKKKGMYLGLNYGYRVVGMVLFNILLTGLEVMTVDGGEGAARMWMAMISRIATLIMSYVWGTFVGMNIVKIDNEYLDFKTSTMTQFTEEYKKGIYKIHTVEERAKEAYDERMRASLAIVDGETAKEVGNGRKEE